MDFFNFIAEFSYPSAIIAAYIAITLTKHYSEIDSKYYLLIAIITGICIVVLEEIISNPITIQKIIAGALSGIIALFSYDSINKIIHNKNK